MATEEPNVTWGADAFDRRPARAPRVRADRSGRPVRLMDARGRALIVDSLILALPLLAAAYGASLAFPGDGFFFQHSASSATLTLGLPGLLLFSALSLSYFFICEALTGQTIGKRYAGICVRSASGGPAGLRAISGRTVLRLIDGLVLYLVGLLVALLSGSRRRRLGDLAGGTVVVPVEPGFELAPPRPAWQVMAFPACWIAGVALTVFAGGLGTAESERAQAISLVRAYQQARAAGDATAACSMMTAAQQQELVAIESGSYRDARAQECPRYVLGAREGSSLRSPELPAMVAAPLLTGYSRLGAVVVHSPEYPSVFLVAVHEGNAMKLDVRGLQRLEFIAGCSAAATGHRALCTCVFDTARIEGRLPERAAEVGILRPIAVQCARSAARA